MPRNWRCLSAVIISLCLVAEGSETARADESSTAIVAAFQTNCTSELPNFARIEGKAAAENLPVNIDAGTPRQAEGFFNHLKSWVVQPTTGVYELSAIEARGPAGEFAACAITAPGPEGEAVKQDLVRALNLGSPEREGVSEDGARRTSRWRVEIQGERVTLLLIDGTPAHGSGVYLYVAHQLTPGS